ncbi:formimidoyltransferase-cyclodeaminase-like [Oscarella lobularis]|uniref:formimidoyltransferase-cyclodeaminase-like n=1 Tax=Oscarella lobularis TaxID=121494 RepID=UPI0033132316
MAQLVVCAPNFSEGRRQDVISAIGDAMSAQASLIDVNVNEEANRTAYTIVGAPDAVIEALMAGAKVAKQKIDMETHTGTHPRMGALDVCPFKPIKGMSPEGLVLCSRHFGRRLGDEMGVPVYMYEMSATHDYRKTLAQIREGQYEGLAEKIVKPEWKPDYGPACFVPSWGATVAGARPYSVNFNVNLLATKEQANRIALNIREEGRSSTQPGRLKAVKAQGRFHEEQRLVQVAVTIVDTSITSIHEVYEECLKDAKDLRVAVVGSHLEGIVPLGILISAADYYIKKDDLFISDEEQKVKLAIERLGLDSLHKFDPKTRILENIVGQGSCGPILSMQVRKFVESVGGRTYTPGGLTVAATTAALGAALGSMSGWMTFGLKKFQSVETNMRQLIPPLVRSTEELLNLMDASYQETASTATSVSGVDSSEIQVPLQILKSINKCWTSFLDMAKYASIACKPDMQIGAKSLETGAWAAMQMLRASTQDLVNVEQRSKITSEARGELQHCQDMCREVLKILDERV